MGPSILTPPVVGTYASLALLTAGSATVGQAVFAACGRREWSWLSPAVGLSIVTAVAWGTVRLPGEGSTAAVALGAVVGGSLLLNLARTEVSREVLRTGLAVTLLAAALTSLPFIVEGRLGILGTGLNPDMSQHLLAAERLGEGGSERLAESGYPLGPHSLVVALGAIGPDSVEAFGGLTLAIAVAAALAPLALLWRLSAERRVLGALLVGLPYMGASYLVQGAFKETMVALVVLAFAIGLHELGEGRLIGGRGERRLPGCLPLAALGIGAVYSYSFPGLLWLAGAAGLWALLARPRGLLEPARAAIAALLAACAPELGRLVDFGRFETFDPAGAGLGNLFNRISPLEALGIWPSGDFRIDPGDGAVPAVAFYAGAALALAALAYGLAWWLRRREYALPAALATAAALCAYGLVSGTPYQEAKAIAIAAPLAMLVAVRPLLGDAPGLAEVRRIVARREIAALFPHGRRRAIRRLGIAGLAAPFLLAAAACSLLALANGPVGPETWSDDLAEVRAEVDRRSTLVLAPDSVLDAHGRDFLVWELRGGRVCVEQAGGRSAGPAPAGIAWVLTKAPGAPPYAGLAPEGAFGSYRLWSRAPQPGGTGPCPLISPGQRADPDAG